MRPIFRCHKKGATIARPESNVWLVNPPASMTMTWEPGKLDHGRIALSDIKKRDPQLSMEITLGDPVQTVEEQQAEQAGAQDPPQPGSWVYEKNRRETHRV